MPARCKNLFAESFDPTIAKDIKEGKDPRNEERELKDSGLTPEEIQFLSTTRTLSDFKVGLTIPGKLLPRRIPGGVLLVDTDFTMR